MGPCHVLRGPAVQQAEESETSVMDAWRLQNVLASFVVLFVGF